MSQPEEEKNSDDPKSVQTYEWGFPIRSIIDPCQGAEGAAEDENKDGAEGAVKGPKESMIEISYGPPEASPEEPPFFTLPGEPEKKPEPVSYTTLVVSGGSIKGNIALGALQYAADRHYLDQLHTYIGTSIGSAIVYLMAIGYTPKEIMIFLCVNHVGAEFKHFNFLRVVNGEGSFSFDDVIGRHLEKMTLEKLGQYPTFQYVHQKFGKKLILTTYNLTKDREEYLSIDTYPEMPVLVAIKMSCLLPLIFQKFRYMGCSYTDGGLGDNFPASQAGRNEKTLGINMLPRLPGMSPETEDDLLAFIHHLIFTPVLELVKKQSENRPEKCDIIEIAHEESPLQLNLENKEKLELFSKGYNIARKFFEDL